MDRDQIIVSFRPKLSITLAGDKNELELFMHETLRPILKFQHDHIVQCIRSEKHLKIEILEGSNASLKQQYATDFIQKNSSLKRILTGFIVGLFTKEEMTFFNENKKDVTKRIIDMIITRFLSTFN